MEQVGLRRNRAQSPPKSVKSKIKGRKLRSVVYWHAQLKGVKQGLRVYGQ